MKSARSIPFSFLLLYLLATAPPAGEIGSLAVGFKVLDGDSLIARWPDGCEEQVRLLGVDAPEHGQAMADAARAFLRQRVEGRSLWLQSGAEPHDMYGRLLAFVTAGERLVNLDLVEAGMAVVSARAPEAMEIDGFLAAQARAHAAGLGIWGPRGPLEEPRSFRRRKENPEEPARPLRYEDWALIGNSRSLVVHWPGCRHADTMPPRNRVCFTSLAEAETQGYRPEKGYE